MGLRDPMGPNLDADENSAMAQVPWPTLPTCTERAHCLRAPYDDEGRCKKHADEHRYAMMRALERTCRRGTRVRCLANHEWMVGTAASSVRLVPRDGIPTRGRWPSVLVQLDGHQEPAEWPAIDVELLYRDELAGAA